MPSGSAMGKASPVKAPLPLPWRPTKIMNMRDLSKDDDFLSHLLVEKLGTGTVPLLVHKMDSSRRLPKTDAQDLLAIVRRLVASKGLLQHNIRQAVDELLMLPPIRYYLKSYTQKQINAFATHASRYFELYNPLGFIEIAHTSRYSHRTGKCELCILATRHLAPGTVITELKGSMANLTEEEDKELKRTDLRNSDIRRDFSVIHSKQMKKNHLFLGPARFVNHDCDNNCELFREGKYITFRVLRPIAIGEEITAHYGDGYFGRKNRHCLCETCEKRGKGGYAPENAEEEIQLGLDSGSDSDSDSDTSSSDSDNGTEEAVPKLIVNIDERRTRRGVYAIMKKKEEDSDESEDEDDNNVPLANAQDIPADGEIELTTEVDTGSELTSLAPSIASDALMTPAPDSRLPSCSSSLSSLSSLGDSLLTPRHGNTSPFRSIISTRRQKAKEGGASSSTSNQQLVTPPLSEDSASLPETSSTPEKRVTRSVSSLRLSANKDIGKGKEKEKTSTPSSSPNKNRRGTGQEDVKIKKEETDPRPLRTRPSTANVVEAAKEPPPPPEVPRGPDGKPLPLCFTCSNVLPVISVDSKIIWGLNVETSPRKKKNKQDCPRCMRHLAIYGQSWPCRIPPHGTSFLPTPREEATPVESASSRRVTQKALPVLDRKLAAAASASAKSRKHDDDPNERPVKRRKTEPVQTVETSPKIKKVPVTVSHKKRHSLPKSAPPPPSPSGEKRKRGRPRLRSPSPTIKVEESASKLDAKPQPRDSNGRFEKKSRPAHLKRDKVPSPGNNRTVLSRAERAVEREKAKEREEDDEKGSSSARTSPRRKRMSDTDGRSDELPRKRACGRLEEDQEPLKKVLPRPASSFRGGKLFSNPNPLSFALQAWAGPMILDESSSEDDKPPVTPEDHQSPPATTIAEGDSTKLSLASLLIPPPIAPPGATAFKPSPFNFRAKRRWALASPSSSDHGSDLNPEDTHAEELKKPIPSSVSEIGSNSRLRARDEYGSWMLGPPLNSDDEEYDLSDASAGRLTPVSDGYPSAMSSDEEGDYNSGPHLRHSYPGFAEATYPKASCFTSNEPGSAPNFINAGWDSCSDTSDL